MIIKESFSYFGNKDLYKKKKIGLFCSRKVFTQSVLPTLDWAVDISNNESVVVMSGFQSMIERKVLSFLLKGKCGIILVLAKRMYKIIPKEFESAIKFGRLLIISLENNSVTRVSRQTVLKRNKFIIGTCDELKLVGIDSNSSVYSLL